MVDIIIFLTEGRRKENDFTQIVSNYYSINSALSKLVDAGLASLSVESGRYQTRWYELTPLGYDIGADLKRAANRISGLLPDEPKTNCSSPSDEGSMAR